MKKRIFYIISFLVIFCIEVFIALYVRDSFVRPYMGDALVVVLVYSFVRIFIPTGVPRLPFYVFLFACFVEVLQYFQLVETLGITNRALRIILGSTLIGITDSLVWRLLIVRSLYFRFLKSDSDRVRNTCRTAHCLHALTDGSSDILCLFSVYIPSSWRRTQYR